MRHAWRIQGQEVDHASRLFIALGGLVVIAERHLFAGAPLSLSMIAARLSLPEPLIESELRPLVRAELLVVGDRSGDPVYTLAHDVDAIHLGQVLRLLEQTWTLAPLSNDGDRRLKGLLESRVLARDPATSELTLRELVKHWGSNEPLG